MIKTRKNKIKKIPAALFLLCFSFACTGAIAQMKKADSYYNSYQYSNAIPLYKKSAKNNDEALEKLADCYRMIKNYQQAEIYYGQLATKKQNDLNAHLRYAEALMNNNKFEEAKKEFAAYLNLKPDDKRAKLFSKACNDIKLWAAQPVMYKVYNLREVNTKGSDFSPTVYKDGIVFSSENPKDLVMGSSNAWTGNPYLSLMYAKAHKEKDTVLYSKAKPLSYRFNNDYLNGPATFSSDQNTIYFTRADNISGKKGNVNLPKIFSAKLNGTTWKSFEAFPFNSDAFSVGHPSVVKDGQTLYFASTMPGGFGGSDIYISKKQDGSWGKPENLGPEINTSGDESYPVINANGTLYFASNGHPNFGGLDIFYSIPIEGKWSSPVNMMPPVNSTTDDFGIVFKDEKSGFFSSNRDGGKGSDDIYGFNIIVSLTSITGKILLSYNPDDAAKNVKVLLLTENGVMLQQAITNQSGFFRFENISPDAKYMVRLDENDPAIAGKPKFYLADSKNKLVRLTVKNGNGFFVFENLPPDLTQLEKLIEDDPIRKNISVAGSLLGGDERAPLVNATVNLTIETGEIIQTVTTNAFGAFVFTNLPPDKNYLIGLVENDPAIKSDKVYFVNKSGKEIALLDKKGKFTFQLLSSDKTTLSLLAVKDVDLRMDLKGRIVSDDENKLPVANSKVHLVNEKGEILQSAITDAFGGFSFANLPADKNYLVSVNEEDVALTKKSFIIIDDKGKIIGKLYLNSGKFKFEVLPTEQKSLATIYVDDPWLRVNKMKSQKKDSLIIIENIYYDYGKWNILPEAKVTLDKAVKVMKDNPDIIIELSSHTDSRATDYFNMTLSEKRAKNTVKYITSKGIDTQRISGKGYGETKLINQCKSGLNCSEEEHAQNRRTEFKITQKKE